ncbi:DUF309 domain-containing protein [Pseudonocardia sp. CA-107938]|uniref:DUF309 domain-containing protein n=1 Tax=Pseudonocardia sp. CA-107938 TaxID=3240021 RepID=UPI003D8FE925
MRDRDTTGRARNARPRDAAGRPLPRGATGVARVPDDLVLSPDATVVEAQRLLDDGLPFPAHDVLEAAWKAAAGAERPVWRALAQLAVGLTHVQRGNARGAAALLTRSADALARWIGPPVAGVDTAGLARWACELADRIERDGLDGVAAEELRPQLRR